MGGRDTTFLEHHQRKMRCFKVRFCPFLGCEGIPPPVGDGKYCGLRPRGGGLTSQRHSYKILLGVVQWSQIQGRVVDIIETLQTSFCRRDTTYLEHQKRQLGYFGVRFNPFLACEEVSHRLRWVIWWSQIERKGLTSQRYCIQDFNVGGGMYPTQISDKAKWGVSRFLPIGQYAHPGALISQGPFFLLIYQFFTS